MMPKPTLQSQLENAYYGRQTISGITYTILDLLEVPNPIIRTVAGTKTLPLHSRHWVQISEGHISRLDGFTNTNFNEIYEDLLSQTALLTSDGDKDLHLRCAYCAARKEVVPEHDFDYYLGPWVAHSALYCIDKTEACLQDRLGTPRQKHSISRCHELKGQDVADGKIRRPDWVIL